MPHRAFHGTAFSPEEVAAMAIAFTGILRELKLTDREDPITDVVAHKLLTYAQMGELDPDRLRSLVLESFADKDKKAV